MRYFSALAALLLLAACTPPKDMTVSERPAIEERAFTVQGASGFDGPWIEFATRDHGYAMFTSCGSDSGSGSCKALLFSTDDGAKTWQAREHPQPVARNQQMYVTGADVVVLLSEPDAWYVTHDGAKTWQRSAYVEGKQPPEYPMGDNGRFYVDDAGVLHDKKEPGKQRQVPEDAALVANGAGGVLWLSGHRDGSPVTWVGRSGPDSWEPVPVPKQEGRPVFLARVAISADGKDTWLIAEQEPVGGGGGTLRARGSLLKATGLPLIWRLANGSWVPVSTAGIVEKPTWSYSAAPAGEGMLAVSGPDGLAYLRDVLVRLEPEPVLGWVGQLRDGALFGQAPNAEAVYLSSGKNAAGNWTKVVLSR